MSRSNPTAAANPSNRWFKWSGSNGTLKYYDKATEVEVEVPIPFTFLFLDELATIKGWHDPSASGIFSNEVRNTQEDKLFVKAFKGGEIASGLYAEIKDKLKAAGGKFNTNIYIAFKDANDVLTIGSLQLKGAALSAWMEFKKTHRKDLTEKAITITGAKDGQKGAVKYKTPEFKSEDTSAETNAAALELDKQVQEYLTSYLSRKGAHISAPVEDGPVESHEDTDDDGEEVIVDGKKPNKMPF